MKQPLVSVALATFNGERYLPGQLDSIANQSYDNLEIVACDDGSTDKTVEILKEYSTSCNLRWHVNSKNIGFVKNFEKAISLSRGEFIALSDQDDIWRRDKIEVLVANIGNYSLIYSDTSMMDENDNIFVPSKKREYLNNDHTGISFLETVFVNYVVGNSCMFRKDILDLALPIPDGQPVHDWWLAAVASKRNGIKYYDDQLVMYRQHRDNVAGYERLSLVRDLKKMFLDRESRNRQHVRRIEDFIERLPLTAQEEKVADDAVLYFSCAGRKLSFRRYYLWFKYRNSLYMKSFATVLKLRLGMFLN